MAKLQEENLGKCILKYILRVGNVFLNITSEAETKEGTKDEKNSSHEREKMVMTIVAKYRTKVNT